MTRYDYECPQHGRVEIIKPMEHGGDPVWCAECAGEDIAIGNFTRRDPMKRIYNPQRFIIRPSFYNCSPDDPQFSNFDRELELNEVRSPGDLPESRGATVTQPRTTIDHSRASIEAERNLRQAVEAAIVEV